jgi:orotidine 5'-phosphate decarboxylase subfamily 1
MPQTKSRLTFKERAGLCTNSTAKKLWNIMANKHTNLAVNPDVTSATELLRLANLLGPYICILKTHIDIVKDFDKSLPKALKDLAEKYNFLLFEDRKFSDIGSVVKMQYQEGIYQIASWADITNAHPVPGPGVIEGLREAGLPLGRGLLLVAEMSSSGSLAHAEYTDAAIEMALDHSDFVMGFISQRRLIDDPRFIHLTPGVKLATGKDSLGQLYNTPEKVIKENGSDVIIVGRGIIGSSDPASEAARYRDVAMNALR